MTRSSRSGRNRPSATVPLEHLIAAPLVSATRASAQVVAATVDFLRMVGTNDEGGTRTVDFEFTRPVEQASPGEEPTVTQEPVRVSLPILAIVPIPNLQIDTLKANFSVEARPAAREAGEDPPPMAGRLSSHREHTRSTDRSAKYSISLSASTPDPSEALSRVRDLMAHAVAPVPTQPRS